VDDGFYELRRDGVLRVRTDPTQIFTQRRGYGVLRS
jgi:hypothetical protein